MPDTPAPPDATSYTFNLCHTLWPTTYNLPESHSGISLSRYWGIGYGCWVKSTVNLPASSTNAQLITPSLTTPPVWVGAIVPVVPVPCDSYIFLS